MPVAIAELERRLVDDPTDGDTALVYADALLSAGDARGELIVIQHELAQRPPDLTRVESLSRRLGQLFAQHADWVGKPGGYPFQRRWRQYRAYVRYGMGYGPGLSNFARLRGAAGLALFKRVRAFLEELTTSTGPVMVNLANVPDGRRLLELVGPGTVRDSIWTASEPPTTPLHAQIEDVIAVHERRTASPLRLSLRYEFQLTYPGSTVPLPYQDGVFYPSGAPLGGSLLIDLAERTCNLYVRFPFEDFDDAFRRCHDGIEKALGRCFTRNAWYRVTPDAKGTSEIVRKASLQKP